MKHLYLLKAIQYKTAVPSGFLMQEVFCLFFVCFEIVWVFPFKLKTVIHIRKYVLYTWGRKTTANKESLSSHIKCPLAIGNWLLCSSFSPFYSSLLSLASSSASFYCHLLFLFQWLVFAAEPPTVQDIAACLFVCLFLVLRPIKAY